MNGVPVAFSLSQTAIKSSQAKAICLSHYLRGFIGNSRGRGVVAIDPLGSMALGYRRIFTRSEEEP